MDINTAEMIDEKRRFVRAIETMLAADQKNNQVDCLHYGIAFHDEVSYDEYIEIIYSNGYKRRILATANSNGANLQAIIKEVY
ncbi:MAG: hypothetical protein U0M21_00535 [Emergencia sp.]|nr:hypothetical protein [Emergencia sp.]